MRIREDGGPDHDTDAGPYVQISRLGNPLVNEVLIPMATKDFWNRQQPAQDSQFASHYTNPELAQLLPALYTPNGGATVFPHLAAYNAASPNRADLVAILLTGIPAGVVSPTYSTFTGPTPADMLRLNLAIPPVANASGQLAGNNMGALGGSRRLSEWPASLRRRGQYRDTGTGRCPLGAG